MAEEYKKVYGWVEGVGLGKTSSGDQFFKIVIDGKQYNWFTETCELKVGDYVSGLFFEVPNPKNRDTPYKNVKSLELTTPPKEEIKPDKDFDLAAVCAAILASGTSAKQNDPEEWIEMFADSEQFDRLICAIYNRVKMLRTKMCGKAA